MKINQHLSKVMNECTVAQFFDSLCTLIFAVFIFIGL